MNLTGGYQIIDLGEVEESANDPIQITDEKVLKTIKEYLQSARETNVAKPILLRMKKEDVEFVVTDLTQVSRNEDTIVLNFYHDTSNYGWLILFSAVLDGDEISANYKMFEI